MMERVFIRGRIVAKDLKEAMDILKVRAEAMGYQLKPGRTVKLSPVQPWPEDLWWDYNVEVKKIA